MAAYLEKGKKLMEIFPTIYVEVILLAKNANADVLAKLALMRDAELLDVMFIDFLAEPSIRQQPEIMELVQEPSWMDPIVAYLKNGQVPEDKTEAHTIRLNATRYVLYEDKLYWRGYSMLLLKCVPPSEAEYIMREINKGICGNHAGGQSLVCKTLRQGYYWPTMKIDCMEFARRCDKCQWFSLISKAYLEELITMTNPWPFAVWGTDLIG